MKVTIRTDSMAAIGAWSKERSTTPNINMVVREMALDQAEGLYAFDVVQHIEGVKNVLADALSRLHEPGAEAEIPSELVDVLRDTHDPRVRSWWKVWSPLHSKGAGGDADLGALGMVTEHLHLGNHGNSGHGGAKGEVRPWPIQMG